MCTMAVLSNVCYCPILPLFAVVGNDVDPLEVTIYSFQPEEAPLTVLLTVRQDETYENTESFTVQIISTSAGSIDPDLGQTTVNILDVDSE